MHAFARGRRHRGTMVAASFAAVLATALSTVITVLPASTAHAVEPVAGPIDPNTGYPFWYTDDTGAKFELCLDRPDTVPGRCLAAPENPAARPWVDVDPARSNLAADPETFWFNAEAEVRDGTRRVRFVAAQEAAFGGADGAARAGEQIAFGRVRVRLNGMVPGASYTVTQPYGTNTYTADEDGQVFVTEDIGCFDLPCDFTKPNASSVTSYLRWDPAVGGAAPAGYVGDPTVPHEILPGPAGFDFFRVRGPNVGGPGVNVVRTDLFNVQGKLWNPTQPMLGLVSTHNDVDFGTVALGSTGALPAQTVTLTNAGGGQTPLRLQGLTVSGANGAQFTLANNTCTNASLAPGATCTVDVTYTPGAIAGPATAQLNVPSTNGKDSAGGQRILLHARVSNGTGKDARVTGPIDPVNGFPQWYQDEAGTRVALCDDQNDPMCVLPDVPEGSYDPALPLSFPTNFPSELFWWNADAGFDGTNSLSGRGVSARLVLAQEAAFVTEDPIPGDQVAFGRIRVRVSGLQLGGTYNVTTPYGDYTFVAEDDGTGVGEINYTEDIGCQETPCDFDRVNQSNVGPFLRQVGAPAGYLGNPNVTAPVTGGPNGNVFAISGPGVNQQTNLFAVSGKEQAGPVGSSHLTVSSTTATVTPSQPASVTLTNIGDATANPQLSLPADSGFSIVDNGCAGPLASSASCTVTVGLDPRAPAQPGQTAVLQVSDGSTPVLRVTLQAAADPRSQLTASVTSATVTPSQPASVTLTNVGDAAADPRVSLPANSGFSIVDDGCAGPLAPTASCTVTVGLSPQAPADPGQTSVLRVNDGATRVLTVTLLAAADARSELTSSKRTVQVQPRKVSSVKLTNVGTAPATVRVSLPLNSGFRIVDDGCTGTLAASASCIVKVGLHLQSPARPGQTSLLRVDDGGTRALTVTLRRVGGHKSLP